MTEEHRYVYGIYLPPTGAPELERALVERVTAKKVFFAGRAGAAFGYHLSMEREKACFTAAAAVERFVEETTARINELKLELARLETRATVVSGFAEVTDRGHVCSEADMELIE